MVSGTLILGILSYSTLKRAIIEGLVVLKCVCVCVMEWWTFVLRMKMASRFQGSKRAL